MTTLQKKSNSTIQRKIRRVARELESQGWKVRADIRGKELPDMIGNKAPDIEAMKECQRLLIEVETLDSLKENVEYVETLARYAMDKANTRFDLVLTRPRKAAAKSKKKVV